MLAINRIPARRDKTGYQHHARHYSLPPRKKEYSTAKVNKKKILKNYKPSDHLAAVYQKKGGG